MIYDDAMMQTAEAFAKLSHCKRRKVGAVLAKEGRVMCTSYNGTISGEENCCEDDGGNTKEGVSHAEQGVLTFSAKNGISTDGCTMYITLSPCITCARLMIAAGIRRVVFNDVYRITDGIDLLKKHNIRINDDHA